MRSLAVVRGGGSLEDMLYVGHYTVWAGHQQWDWLTIGSGIRDLYQPGIGSGAPG